MTISKESIIKFYQNLRKKLKDNKDEFRKKNFLGDIIGEEGYGVVEIDESEIIGNSNEIYWIFGMIERSTKNVRFFCVLNDRTKNNLLKIVRDNVNTTDDEIDDNDDELNENYSLKTRIYSDCFSSYQIVYFNRSNYILKRVNHSVWFGHGSFHTNTIEGLCSQLKGLIYNFSGI